MMTLLADTPRSHLLMRNSPAHQLKSHGHALFRRLATKHLATHLLKKRHTGLEYLKLQNFSAVSEVL